MVHSGSTSGFEFASFDGKAELTRLCSMFTSELGSNEIVLKSESESTESSGIGLAKMRVNAARKMSGK